MSGITGIKDIDLIILNKLSQEDLFNICQVNKSFSKLCNYEYFWKNKVYIFI